MMTQVEEIEAKRENSGNYVAMQHLLDCMRRRENWPEEFITALEGCEHRGMAADIQAEYDRLQVPSPPNPYGPPSTVPMETVHSPPLVSQQAPTDPFSSLTETTEVPGAPQRSKAPHRFSISEPEAQTSPSPSPPSLEMTHLPAHQEPEENSEEFVSFVGGPGLAAASCDVTAETGSPTPPPPESMETRLSSEQSEPPPGSVCSVDSWEDPGSASVTMTPTPETDPPNFSEPKQVVNSVQPTAVPPVVGVDRPDPIPEPDPAGLRYEEDNEVCFSKPGVLLSVQPNMTQHATLPTTSLSEPSFSGNVSLQISDPERECSGTPPEENHYASDILDSFAEREAQEVLEHIGHVAEEPSIQNLASPAQGILGNAVHASQDQRWDEKRDDGQPEIVVQSPSSYPPPPGGDERGAPLQELPPQILNGEASPALANEQVPALVQAAAVRLPQEPKKDVLVVSLSPRTRHVLGAVGIAACAMFVAWRLKN
ncbi:hypothetical protein NHX12_019634 [Muraenolepis orangiensis]|uniref:Caspase recruitment domain-containing protein n=1 Tax=Muraenolepis orangiensis TaxID=630683 RepID=A0A9Q0EX12_9TELE|nr:hypothetical protein NHX12_019634 [Muraenolepis orangiensis]